MLFDTHSHFNDEAFNEDLTEVMDRARKAGVRLLNIVGFDIPTIKRALEIVDLYDEMYLTVGFHPVEAIDFTDEIYNMIKDIALNHKKLVAIGEIGLDYHWDKSPKEIQKEVFRKQIRLAKEVKKPIVIHTRDAIKDTMDILKEEKANEVGVIMHCFSGSVEIMEMAIKEGYYISLGGTVTFKNAKTPKEVAKKCPLDKLLIETDCPYLAPTPYRGKRNESSYVKYVAEQIANLKNLTYEEVATATFNNACRILKINEKER